MSSKPLNNFVFCLGWFGFCGVRTESVKLAISSESELFSRKVPIFVSVSQFIKITFKVYIRSLRLE